MFLNLSEDVRTILAFILIFGMAFILFILSWKAYKQENSNMWMVYGLALIGINLFGALCLAKWITQSGILDNISPQLVTSVALLIPLIFAIVCFLLARKYKKEEATVAYEACKTCGLTMIMLVFLAIVGMLLS